ncbi:MAG TPA: GrpB family protein [Ktedonobacterales bacterium]|nr:GrpB family protein [Ktedonobacterales bacterium]
MGATVVLADYDPHWPERYEYEKRRIAHALGNRVVAIEHIGSTAVPGLGAKPIIDIMVAVRSLERDLPACIEPLRRLGYEHVERTDFTDSCFFCHGAWGPSTRHLHITEYGSAFWNEKLLFRDFLRLHNDTADEYFALKRSLAAKHATNRTAYTDAKSSYIHGVVNRARATTLGPSIANRIERRAHK